MNVAISKLFTTHDVIVSSFITYPLFVGDMMPERVLNLHLVSRLNNGFDNRDVKHRRRWTVQRIRLSPREKHLAATVKSDYREELR